MKLYRYFLLFFTFFCFINSTALEHQESLYKNQNEKKIQAYFSPDDSVADIFISYIKQEKESIDIAIYTLTHTKIIQSLIEASKRNVAVTVIIDEFSLSANNSRGPIDKLIEAGVSVYLFNPKTFFYGGSGNAQLFFNQHPTLSRYRDHEIQKNSYLPKEKYREFSIRPLMHHKFCIFGKNINNESIVWTGSFNFTFCATSRNQENVLIINDPNIGKKFKKQLEIIKNERSQQLHPYQTIIDKHGVVELLFTPDQEAMSRLVQLIDEESESIKIAIYSLSNTEIIESLIKAHSRGVKVEIILDHGKYADLIKSGISVYLFDKKNFNTGAAKKQFNKDEDENRGQLHAIMHNKFCIFKKNVNGKKLLWTGSMNFTFNSDLLFQNNALIIDDIEIIEKFEQQFERIKNNRCMLPNEIANQKHKKRRNKN